MPERNPYIVALLAFALVFAGLGLLAAVLFLMRALRNRLGRPQPRLPDGSLVAKDGTVIDPRTMALLAAAAHAALGAPVIFHRVHVHHQEGGESWARAGRMDVFYSHRVERKR